MPRARVLAVDDQRYFRELMDSMLSEEGYEVRTVSGGAEALHALEREHFDIVVTDVMMPEMDGTELIERIKQGDEQAFMALVDRYKHKAYRKSFYVSLNSL